MPFNLLAISGVNGEEVKNFGQGAIISIVSILLVFSILAIIIGITYFIGNLINKTQSDNIKPQSAEKKFNNNTLDEDATVAVLVASIDYRNETKKNVKVLSVKEIK